MNNVNTLTQEQIDSLVAKMTPEEKAAFEAKAKEVAVQEKPTIICLGQAVAEEKESSCGDIVTKGLCVAGVVVTGYALIRLIDWAFSALGGDSTTNA